MIIGKAKLEFGTGSIGMTPVIRDDGVGALCMISAEAGEVGRRDELPEDWTPAQAEVIMTFTNPESVLGVINNLAEVYKMILDQTVNPNLIPDDYWARNINLDFDAFMKDPGSITREYSKDGSFKEYKED